MFHPELVFEGFTADDWSRIATTCLPPDAAESVTAQAADGGEPDDTSASGASSFVNDLLDAACPNGRALVVGIFDAGELWASLAFSRRDGLVDKVVGTQALRPRMGLLSGDFRRDYRHLQQAAEELVGELALGAFSDRPTLEQLASARTPGSWARAVAVRDVILSPFSPVIAVPLGLDAARAGMGLMRTLADKYELARFLAR